MKRLTVLCLAFFSISSLSSLAFTPPVLSEPEEVPKIFLSPNTSSQAPSGTFTVDVNVMDVRQLYAWQFYLSWTNLMLNATKTDEGPFLDSSGAYNSFFGSKIFNNPAERPVLLHADSSRTQNFLYPESVTQLADDKGASTTGGADGDFVAGSQFAVETGNIEGVAISMRYRVTAASTSDEVKLGYSVSGVEGPTGQSFKPTSTAWTYVDLNVTADRKWTRNDIANTEVFLRYDRIDAADTWTIEVDVLQVQFYSSYIYVLDVLLGVDRLGSPSGSGTIATVTFLAEAQGVSTLELWGVKLIDFDGARFVENPVPPQYAVIVEDGYFAYPIARMSVDPSSIIDSTKGVGSTFSVNINITGAESVYNWSLALKWDASLLDATTVTEGSFLSDAGTTSFNSQINQAAGNLTASCILTGAPFGGVNGSGVLLSVTFDVEGKGSTVMDAYSAKLFDQTGAFMPHDVAVAFDVRNDGFFSNQRRDVSISEIRLSTTSVMVGDFVSINVTVMNLGEINETFTVTVFYASTSIGSRSVTNLGVGDSTTLTLTCVTTNVPVGEYEIKAQTSTILGDVNTADNSLVASSHVTIALERTIIQEFIVDGTLFNVTITSNSTVSNIAFNAAQKMISFSVTGPNGTVGHANVTVPLNIMWGPWVVLVDGLLPPDSSESSNGSQNILYVAYSHSTHTVTLISTGIMPEFPFGDILAAVFMLLTLVGTIIGKRKFSKTDPRNHYNNR